jgi:hypothetical protein
VQAWLPFFNRGSDPHPPRESTGMGACFIFYPWVTRGYLKFQILMVATQSAHLNSCEPRSFGLAQHYPPLKSGTITLGGVHLTHQPCSSLGSSVRHALMIKFTSTLLKPARNPTGVAFHLQVWPQVGLGGCHRCGCRRVFVKPTLNLPRCHP